MVGTALTALLVIVFLACILGSTVYVNSQSNTGTCTASFPAGGAVPGVTPLLTSLQISQSGGSVGPNSKLNIWDGPIGSGTLIYSIYLGAPGGGGTGATVGGLGGSVGIVQDIPLPRSPAGIPGIQALPGNQMNIQVVGTANNNVSINARFSDGLPTGP